MSTLQPPILKAAIKDYLPSDAEFEAYMLGVIRRVSVGDGILGPSLGADITSSDNAAEPAVLQQLYPQSPVLQRIQCPAAQTLSSPLAVGKVYRADQQMHPLSMAGRAVGEATDLVGAYYPRSPMAPSPSDRPNSPAVAAAKAFAHISRTGLDVVAWPGAADPKTPTANLLQPPVGKLEVQTGTPKQYLAPPPPPPPRPVPMDDPLLRREQLYQDKVRSLEEREKIVSRSIEQLKVDRAYLLGIHAENQARRECHAVASKELEAQANILRRAAQQQQVKEAELANKESLLCNAYKALEVAQDKVQKSEAAVLCQQEGLRREIEALNLAQQVKMLLDAPKLANSAAEAAITAGCPHCAERALKNLAKVEPAYEKTMAERLRAIATSGTSDSAQTPKTVLNDSSTRPAVHASKGTPAAMQNSKKPAAAATGTEASNLKRTSVRVSTPSKGDIKILFREKSE